jgi:hypothetical protein
VAAAATRSVSFTASRRSLRLSLISSATLALSLSMRSPAPDGLLAMSAPLPALSPEWGEGQKIHGLFDLFVGVMRLVAGVVSRDSSSPHAPARARDLPCDSRTGRLASHGGTARELRALPSESCRWTACDCGRPERNQCARSRGDGASVRLQDRVHPRTRVLPAEPNHPDANSRTIPCRRHGL